MQGLILDRPHYLRTPKGRQVTRKSDGWVYGTISKRGVVWDATSRWTGKTHYSHPTRTAAIVWLVTESDHDPRDFGLVDDLGFPVD